MQKSGFLGKLQLLCASLLSFSIYVRKPAWLRDAYVKLTEGTTKLEKSEPDFLEVNNELMRDNRQVLKRGILVRY